MRTAFWRDVLRCVRLTRLALALIVVIEIADVLFRHSVYLGTLLLICPPLAAALAPPRAVLAVGLLALATRLPLYAPHGEPVEDYDAYVWINTVTLIAVTGVSMNISRRREQRERRLTAVTSVAEAAQHALLPPMPPSVGGLKTAVLYQAAAREAQIGGDLYKVVDTAYGIRAMIGDVRGKGLGAVHTSAVVLGAFREAARRGPDLSAVAAEVEDSLLESLEPEEFVTALFAGFHPDGRVEMVSRGHVSPTLITADGRARTLDAPDPGLPLGLGTLGADSAAPWTVRLRPGDRLLLCTDGVTEARDPDGTFYPLADRLPALAAGARDGDDLLRRLRADLVGYTGDRLDDDVAVLLLTVPAAPLERVPSAP